MIISNHTQQLEFLHSGEPAAKVARVGTKFDGGTRAVAEYFGGEVKTQASASQHS